MKSTSICPKCDGRKVYAVSPVRQTYCDAGGSLKPFVLTGAELPTGGKGLFGGESKDMQTTGPLDAYVCAACGYVEWIMPQGGLRMLERLLDAGAGVGLVPAPPAAPFR